MPQDHPIRYIYYTQIKKNGERKKEKEQRREKSRSIEKVEREMHRKKKKKREKERSCLFDIYAKNKTALKYSTCVDDHTGAIVAM